MDPKTQLTTFQAEIIIKSKMLSTNQFLKSTNNFYLTTPKLKKKLYFLNLAFRKIILIDASKST